MDVAGLRERVGCFFLMVGLVTTGILALLVRNQQLDMQLWCIFPPLAFLFGLNLYWQAQRQRAKASANKPRRSSFLGFGKKQSQPKDGASNQGKKP
jgi:hypothetical protein